MRAVIVIASVMMAFAASASYQGTAFCAEGRGRAPARLLPADEASQQPDFFTFRARLQTAVAAKDVVAIIAAADPNIRLGFGGDDGAARFKESLTREKAARFWVEFARVLALGGAFKGANAFHAPFYFANWPNGADSFECGVIVGRGVNVRREPRADAAVVGTAHYDLVRHMVAGVKDVPDGWAPIVLSNGGAASFGPTISARPPVCGQCSIGSTVSGD